MRSIFTLSIFLAICFNAHLQDSPVTANTLDFPIYNQDNVIVENLSTMTGSGVPICSGTVGNDDYFYRFVAESNGVKVVANADNFDIVVEIWDEANAQSMFCVNLNGLGGQEYLINNNLTPGNEYFLRFHSADGNSGDGVFSFSYSHLPYFGLRPQFELTSQDGDYYRLFESIQRDFTTSLNFDQTIWNFTRVSDGETAQYVTNGNGYGVQLNVVEQNIASVDIPFFCYGEEYEVQLELSIEGVSCGLGPVRNIIFQAEPNTWVTNITDGAILDPYVGQIHLRNTHYDQVMEWEYYYFETLITTYESAQGQYGMNLSLIPEILYNKPYKVRVRVTSCGTTGPWTDFLQFVTSDDMPYTELLPEFHNADVSNIGSIQCEIIPSATSYIWQFAPIEFNDPTFTPIGPAIVQETIAASIVFTQMPVPLNPGTIYRVGVKPVFGYGEQFGDYGNFHQIGTAGSELGTNVINNSSDNIQTFSSQFNLNFSSISSPMTKSPNYVEQPININGSQKNQVVPFNTLSYKIEVYNSNGVLVSEAMFDEMDSINYSTLLASLSSGIYILKIHNEKFQEVIKIKI